LWAKAVYEKMKYSYGTKQEANVKAYNKDTGVKCATCGEPAVAKSGEKNGRKWSGVFCSSENKSHTKWL
jgi:hypothetical protein